MGKLKFIAFQGALDAWRNQTFSRIMVIYGFLCTLIFGVGGRLYLNVLYSLAVEEQVPDAGGLVNTRPDLLFILRILEKGLLFLFLIFIGLSFAYFITLLVKEFIQQKEELKIKAYIGTSILENSGIFWFSYSLPYLIGELVGFFLSQMIYLVVITLANNQLKGYLLLPRYPFIWIDIPLFLILGLFVCSTFGMILRKIGGIEDEKLPETDLFVDER
ncbi:hypothetical protein IGI37_002517 [Enterococcus sp. AZ194]|uniref:hypothetical protein n=1 Tax=Enterococcus sp. AZ194 TaxID=2774629 RepID=UPI003F2962EA